MQEGKPKRGNKSKPKRGLEHTKQSQGQSGLLLLRESFEQQEGLGLSKQSQGQAQEDFGPQNEKAPQARARGALIVQDRTRSACMLFVFGLAFPLVDESTIQAPKVAISAWVNSGLCVFAVCSPH